MRKTINCSTMCAFIRICSSLSLLVNCEALLSNALIVANIDGEGTHKFGVSYLGVDGANIKLDTVPALPTWLYICTYVYTWRSSSREYSDYVHEISSHSRVLNPYHPSCHLTGEKDGSCWLLPRPRGLIDNPFFRKLARRQNFWWMTCWLFDIANNCNLGVGHECFRGRQGSACDYLNVRRTTRYPMIQMNDDLLW